MDLDLAPEHVLLRDTIRDFMVTEVAPVIDEHERERRFPTEIVRRIGELGWPGILIPEDEGGAGPDTPPHAIPNEGIGRGWGARRPRHARLRDRDRGDRPRVGIARIDRRGPHQPRLRAAPPGRIP